MQSGVEDKDMGMISCGDDGLGLILHTRNIARGHLHGGASGWVRSWAASDNRIMFESGRDDLESSPEFLVQHLESIRT